MCSPSGPTRWNSTRAASASCAKRTASTPRLDAAGDYQRYLLGEDTDNMTELTYPDRKRVHNLKYFTWVEQQGKTYEEIQAQWYQETTGRASRRRSRRWTS